MKKCPFCAEEIQDDAVKCKHCGEFLIDAELKKLKKDAKIKWYYKTSFVVTALLFIGGPFALPLVWFNPQYSALTKTIVSILVIMLSALVVILIIAYFLWVFRIASHGL